MNVFRMALVAFVCFGFVAPVALAQSDAEVAAEIARAKGPPKPWKHVRGYGRVLDLRNPPIVIDQPGLYAIDRNWTLPSAAVQAGAPDLIQITAEEVTLDLHGFKISADFGAPPSGTLLAITERAVEVRNGGLTACCEGGSALRSTAGSRLHHLSVYSHETMTFGDHTSFTDSDVFSRIEMVFGAGANVARNTIGCNRGFYCIRLVGDDNRVTDNRMTLYQGGGIGILGNRNIVANNGIDAIEAPHALEAIVVEGDYNVVRANTAFPGHSPVFAIGGTANTLDGNISAPRSAGRGGVGMQFTADGNFYGNNRVSALLPFDLGGTVQVDWGGNVGY